MILPFAKTEFDDFFGHKFDGEGYDRCERVLETVITSPCRPLRPVFVAGNAVDFVIVGLSTRKGSTVMPVSFWPVSFWPDKFQLSCHLFSDAYDGLGANGLFELEMPGLETGDVILTKIRNTNVCQRYLSGAWMIDSDVIFYPEQV